MKPTVNIETPIIDNPIVEEVQRAGEALFARFNNDMDAVVEYLRECSRKAGREPVSLPKKQPVREPVVQKKKVG